LAPVLTVSDPADRPLVMGVLNVTPDSFSDGGLFLDPVQAIARGRQMIAEGADVIDVGGESSRPGAEPVTAEVELARVVPVIEVLAAEVRISIDTTKPEVARAAVAAGATLVNDISASLHEVAAETGAGWVAMHMRGTPATMQDAPRYDDVVAEVAEHLAGRVLEGRAAGIAEIWIDPGIGFGKTDEHNLALLRHLDRFVDLGAPVVVGTSRKGFLGRILGASDAGDGGADAVPAPVDDRLEGSLATATWAMVQGARMIRAHDVLATVQAARVVAA
jgi:dihydropteroate synthase